MPSVSPSKFHSKKTSFHDVILRPAVADTSFLNGSLLDRVVVGNRSTRIARSIEEQRNSRTK